jgi:hypothetical protein
VQIGNLQSELNSFDGVLLSNTTRCTVSNWECNSNTNIGWVEDGISDFNIKSNGLSYLNGVGSLSQAGTNSAAVNWIAQDGAFRQATVGPAVIA